MGTDESDDADQALAVSQEVEAAAQCGTSSTTEQTCQRYSLSLYQADSRR